MADSIESTQTSMRIDSGTAKCIKQLGTVAYDDQTVAVVADTSFVIIHRNFDFLMIGADSKGGAIM